MKFCNNNELIKILKVIGLIKNIIYFRNVVEESTSQEFRLKEIDKKKRNLIK